MKQYGLYYFISHAYVSHTTASGMSFACHIVALSVDPISYILPNKVVVG